MLQRTLETILRMSLNAGFTCLVVCLLRLALKKAPKIFSYALWAVVFFRFICPVALTSPVSVIPRWEAFREYAAAWESDQTRQKEMSEKTGAKEEQPAMADSNFSGGSEWLPDIGLTGGMLSDHSVGQPEMTSDMSQAETNLSQPVSDERGQGSSVFFGSRFGILLSAVWLCGMCVTMAVQIIRSLRWKKALGPGCPVERGICESSGISVPFVMGLVHPRIYLPAGLTEEQRRYILLHEQTHIRRRDYLIKPAAFVIAAVHWFNPLAWAAFRLMCMDMEMSCDEAVLESMSGQQRKEYARTLLVFAGQGVSGAGLAFGEPYARKRIGNVLTYRRPSYRLMLVLTAICIAASGCMLTNPVNQAVPEDGEIYSPGESSDKAEGDADGEADAESVPETDRTTAWDSAIPQGTTEEEEQAAMKAYLDSFEVGSTAPMITENSMVWEADLNHDGQDEQIVFDWNYFDTGSWGSFAVLDSQGKVIYADELGSAHAGWRTYYLCQRDGKDYLLKYDPGCYQGYCVYSYELLELGAGGQLEEKDSSRIEFYDGPGQWIRQMDPDWQMNIPEMTAFADSINGYMKDSFLLVSTDSSLFEEMSDRGLFITGSPENPQRKMQTYSGLAADDPDIPGRKEIEEQLRELKEQLKAICEAAGIPYIE